MKPDRTARASEFFKDNLSKMVEAGMDPRVAQFHERIMDAVAQAFDDGVSPEDVTEALALHTLTGKLVTRIDIARRDAASNA